MKQTRVDFNNKIYLQAGICAVLLILVSEFTAVCVAMFSPYWHLAILAQLPVIYCIPLLFGWAHHNNKTSFNIYYDQRNNVDINELNKTHAVVEVYEETVVYVDRGYPNTYNLWRLLKPESKFILFLNSL